MPAKSIGCKSTPYSGFPRNTICSHLIWPSVLFFYDDDFDGKLILHCGAKSAISIEKPPVSHECDALPIRMSDLRGDRIGKPVGHAGEIAGESYESVLSLTGMWRAHHVAIVPLSQLTIASSRSRTPSSCAITCGFIGTSRRVARVMHDFSPVFHPFLRFFQEASVFLPLKTRQQVTKNTPAITDQPTSTGNLRPIRLGSSSICTPLAWPGLGKNSRYGNDVPTISKVSQVSIASWDGFVPSSPIVPVVYGLSSGTAALPSNALIIGAPSTSASCSSSAVACSAPRPARIATLFPSFRTCAALSRSSGVGQAWRRRLRHGKCDAGYSVWNAADS